MIRAIVFDLDMCICDTSSIGKEALAPVLKILHGSDLPDEAKTEIEKALWNTSLDDIINIFSIAEPIASAMRSAYQRLETPDGVKTFDDELILATLNQLKILVTSGYIRFQGSKIRKLGIEHLFDAIMIDASDLAEKRKGKLSIFKKMLAANQWQPKEVMVVGDNPLSELGAAKSLGMISVQTLRPTVQKWDEADHHISSLNELPELIDKLNKEY